jgi:benzoate membrane transport protein
MLESAHNFQNNKFMRNYFSFSHMAAGFISVMVGFTSSAVLVFQAATEAGASTAEVSSWLFALGMSIAMTCIGLSLHYRMPILTGWSTPGAALLITSLAGVTMPEAIGAFIFSALLTCLAGVTGLFRRIIIRIPHSLTSAMLAGILLHFGMNVFIAMQEQFFLVATMLLTYLFGKRFFPKYVILIVLMVGILLAGSAGLFHTDNLHFSFSAPILTIPVFTASTLMSIGIPLFVVTMTSQNVPGLAVLDAAGYKPPISSIVSWTGFSSLLFAPFGCYSVNLAAISAAICTAKDVDPDPKQRYRATVFAGFCWLLIALFGSTVVTFFTAFPNALILAIAGLALIGTIGTSLKGALDDETQREPALITLLVSSSGMTLLGIGSAFWGIIAGALAMLILNWRKRRQWVLPNAI